MLLTHTAKMCPFNHRAQLWTPSFACSSKIFLLCYIERQQPAPGSPVIFCSQADTVLVDPPWQCVKVFTLFKMSFLAKQEKRYPPPPEKHYWRHFKMKIPIDSIIPCFYQRWLHLVETACCFLLLSIHFYIISMHFYISFFFVIT